MDEEDLGPPAVPVSALQHYVYCPRQCALIHVERTFEENLWTLRGRRVHERVHEESGEIADGVRVERAVPIWSERLGLVGVADLVEFHGDVPYPVEYKHGQRRAGLQDDVQLCAQALCLEEMLGVAIPRGAIYHHRSRRRREVELTAALRETTAKVVGEVRQLLAAGVVPPPVHDRRCHECSLADACLPDRGHLPAADALFCADPVTAGKETP